MTTESKHVLARFLVHKVGSFVVKDRVLCLGEYSFSTVDRENQQVTNTWAYEDVDGADVLEGETDFIVHTPRHRIKKTVYRCQYRMEVLVCLLRLRSQHYAKLPNAPQPLYPELQIYAFPCLKYHKSGVHSSCVVEICPDGIYQRDSEGDVMSHISYTSLVSIDIICDDDEAIMLNDSDNSSLFIVSKRLELARAITSVMNAYGMQINEYRKKTLKAALQENGKVSLTTCISFEYTVLYVSQSSEHSTTLRTLSASERFLTEYGDAETVIVSRPLHKIYSLIMHEHQTFEVIFVDGVKRQYISAHCEKIVCELLASCHALGNYQVGVESTDELDSVRMIPRKIILQEGNQIANAVTNVNRELRVAQASILQLLAVHGHRKTARSQRQLPRGLDVEMHSLAMELNANTSTPGVVAQPNKPYEKATYVLAREFDDIVRRHGATHEFVGTYLESLYRLTLAPPAINEFMKILTEREDEYVYTILKVLRSKKSVAIYWMFMVLSRLMESKLHKLQCRQLFLTNRAFTTTLLSLLDEDSHTGLFLSDLPTMKLCQFILLLVKVKAEKQREISDTFYQSLATKYRMMLRILFSFPALNTAEACVGILSRMTKNPAFLHFGNLGSPLRSNDGKIPRHSLSFGETLNFGPDSKRKALASPLSRPPMYSSKRNNFASSRSSNLLSSLSFSSGASGVQANGLVVQNPEMLLRQYRHFFEATCGSLKMGIDQYDDPIFLRLRYRCRNVFLQELMSHLVGDVDEFERVYNVSCSHFIGYMGLADGQRDRTKFYVTPRALIAVHIVSNHTHEFEFRKINEITQATATPDAFVLTLKNKFRLIYSEQSNDIIERMKAFAGVIGIHLCLKSQSKLPLQQVRKPLDKSEFQSNIFFDVQRCTGRHGSSHLKKKRLCFIDGHIEEYSNSSKKIYELKTLRQIVMPELKNFDLQALVALVFVDCSRVAYVPYDIESFLAALYDGVRYVGNYNVSLSREFSNLNPRLSARALLRDEQERFLYHNHDGLYIPAHAALEKEIGMVSGEGMSIISTTNKVMLAFENLNTNVEVEDFAEIFLRGRLEKLSFSTLLRGINNLLEYSCKPPIRTNEVCVVLEAFCRVNDGCYRLAMEDLNNGAMVLVSTLAQVLVSGDPVATLWAVNALHSLIADKSRSKAHRVVEKAIRFQVFEHKKLITLLTCLLERRNSSATLVVLHLILDALVISRSSTDDSHFFAIVKDLGGKYTLLLELASQSANAGLAAAVICVLKVVIDHVDYKVRRRICDSALDSGLTVKHLYKAFFHPLDNAKETYQYITSIWVTHHKASHEMLGRILPHGFIRMISNPIIRKLLKKQRARKTNSVQQDSMHNSQIVADKSGWFIRRMQLQIGILFASDFGNETRVSGNHSHLNYPGESSTDMALLSGMVRNDFMLPDLIWNESTRTELNDALLTAIETYDRFRSNQAATISLIESHGASSEVKWNHAQFSVRYESIAQELQVSHFYIRVITERIDDGTLRLAEVANTVHAMEAGTYRGKVKDPSSLFLASMDIAKDPANFFNEVYQCWIEHLHLNQIRFSGTNDLSASVNNTIFLAERDHHGHMMLKVMIELACAFPDARPTTMHRARFLTTLLYNSYRAVEIRDIVELISGLSLSDEACAQLCTTNLINVLLNMSLLLHRCRLVPKKSDLISLTGDMPMMESFINSEANDTSSVPIAELSVYEESRYALKWSIMSKTMETDDSKIEGPFFLNGLKEYMNADSSFCHRHIDVLYVCCCSMHESTNLGIDEHSWKSMFEFPELRWMELVDEPIDASFAAFALKTLRNFLVKDQLTVGAKDMSVFPPALMNTVLANTSSLTLLVQLLYVNIATVRRYTCELLMSLDVEELQSLYQYGVFYFILSAVTNPRAEDKVPSFVPEAALLKRIHRAERSSERLAGHSCLADMLPDSLTSVLDLESSEYFADVYCGRKRDKRVLWSSKMRSHLQEMIGEHLRDFQERLKVSVTAKYIYTSIPPVFYRELSGDLYFEGIYTSSINQSELYNIEVEDPVFLMKRAEEKWRFLARRQAEGSKDNICHSDAYKTFGWREGDKYSSKELRSRYRELCQQQVEVGSLRRAYNSLCAVLECKNTADGGKTSNETVEHILKLQLQLLNKYSSHFFSFESSILDLLIRALEPRLSEDFRVQDFAMKFLQRLLSIAPHNGPFLVAIDGSWVALLDLTERCALGNDVAAKECMFSVLKMILDSEEGVQSLLKADRGASLGAHPSKQPDLSSLRDVDSLTLFSASEYASQNEESNSTYAGRIYSMMDDVILSFENIQPWHIQKMSFDIASSLCRNPGLQHQIMTYTRIFWKGLYLILASAESSLVVDGEQESTTMLEKQEREMIESAFNALRSLTLGPDGNNRSIGLEALANLLPLDFLDRLEKPNGHDFCNILLSDIREPTCIWNESTRAELSKLTEEFCTDSNGDGVSFLESATHYMYDCLSTEPFVGGIYLLILLEKSDGHLTAITENTLYPTTAIDFVEALFCFLNENRDPKLGIYSDTMPALDCISLLCDLPLFRSAIVECLEQHVDDEDAVNASISVATLGRYLLPFDGNNKANAAVSISSRRSLSTYGFKAKTEPDNIFTSMETEFGNVDYLARQEMALLILNKLCGFECNLERMLAPFCQFTWCLQVIADHLKYEQAFYALSCLAELCDTCLVIARYVQESGLWVEILGIALQSRQHVLHEHFLRAEALREPAFEVLHSLLMKDLDLREKMYSGLCRFLPYPIVYQIHLDPSKATRFFDDNHEKSDLIWDSHRRMEVRKKLDQVICRNRMERSVAKRDSVLLDDETDVISCPHSVVAGLYIDRFLSQPDADKLTNPAYNLELLFQLWRTDLDQLMRFDLQNPPNNIKIIADAIDKYTMAMTHILRASLDIDESISNKCMPEQIVKLVRYCNQHLITSFPYRCVLRIARHLVQFPEITSKEFVELLICRVTMQHPDIPPLLKVLRRVLEARNLSVTENESKYGPEYWLKDLNYYSQMLVFLEGLIEKKEQIEPSLLSNANRVLRILRTEKEMQVNPSSRSFMGRWQNFTLEKRSSMRRNPIKTEHQQLPDISTIVSVNQGVTSTHSFDVDRAREDVSSMRSFDVDIERDSSVRVDVKRMPTDREIDIDGSLIQAPPKSINFASGAMELTEVIASRSFLFKGEGVCHSPLPSPTSVRFSILGARYEPIDTQYHSKKAAEYEEHKNEEHVPAIHLRRGSIPNKTHKTDVIRVNATGNITTGAGSIPTSNIKTSNFASQLLSARPRDQASGEALLETSQNETYDINAERRYSLLDSWKAPSSAAPNMSLTTLTISRRGRRAAVVYSRITSKKKKWYHR
ncbi:hypothetical protein Plhal710r2_c039g0137981 [Plasmopara halstedii]